MSRRNVKAWRQFSARPVERELPSGSVVEQKRVSLSALLAQGVVPQAFFAAAQNGANDAGAFDISALTPQAMKDMTVFARHVAKDSLTWPRVVDRLIDEVAELSDMERVEREVNGEREAEASLDDIPLEDLFDIMAWALNGAPVQTVSGEVEAAAIASFREDEHVQGGGKGGEDVRAAAERDARAA